jgi:hypothetical protein
MGLIRCDTPHSTRNILQCVQPCDKMASAAEYDLISKPMCSVLFCTVLDAHHQHQNAHVCTPTASTTHTTTSLEVKSEKTFLE